MNKFFKAFLLSSALSGISTAIAADELSPVDVLNAEIEKCDALIKGISRGKCLVNAYNETVADAISSTEQLAHMQTTDVYKNFIQEQKSADLSEACPTLEEALAIMPPMTITEVPNYVVNKALDCASFHEGVEQDINGLSL